MEKLMLILLALPWLTCAMADDAVNDTGLPANSSDPNKDMYVIHAMVYQVGIVTNKTDNETTNFNNTLLTNTKTFIEEKRFKKPEEDVPSCLLSLNNNFKSLPETPHPPPPSWIGCFCGNQEAVTFFHSNGSQGLDLSKIPAPLLTNVTAQSMVGVAPMPVYSESAQNQLPWSSLNHLTNISPPPALAGSEQQKTSMRSIRSIDIMDSDTNDRETPINQFFRSLFKRDVPVGKTPVAINSGAAVIPQAAGVQSIGIPPLLTLNNNMSDIPVPIPNTSVVHYSKINTLVTKP